MVHPWHNIPLGDNAPEQVNAVIEVPLGSTIKYELDKTLGLVRISHVLYPPVPYPGNYGFLPQTLDKDGDPLDMIVVMRDPVSPLTLCTVRPIGIVNMEDNGENDDKIICVLIDDPVYENYKSLEALPDYEQEELSWFFGEYQKATHDEVEVKGLDGVDAARSVIEECAALYKENFG
jgi:inorganic pyrophosphatase